MKVVGSKALREQIDRQVDAFSRPARAVIPRALAQRLLRDNLAWLPDWETENPSTFLIWMRGVSF